MSVAKNAIDSTFRRVLKYTAEIIMSIFMLVIICIPLAFTIPMWFQHILTDTPRNELTINLILWFGYDGALWLTLLLGLISFSLGYVYILKMKPGISSTDEEVIEDETPQIEDVEETSAPEDIEEEEIPLEDQEEGEEPDLDMIDESLEDEEVIEDDDAED